MGWLKSGFIMPLVVEDGSLVANANSYIDLAYLTSYATARGYTLPTADADKEIFALRAMDYLESRRQEFAGTKVDATQSLQWPRKNVYIDGTIIAEDSIPEELKKAQAQLIVEQQLRTKLFPPQVTDLDRGHVVEEQVGPLKTKYSETKSISSVQIVLIATVEIYLRPLLKCYNGMRTIRL